MPFLRLFVEATVSSVPQDRALAEEACSLPWLLNRTACTGLSCCCLCAVSPISSLLQARAQDLLFWGAPHHQPTPPSATIDPFTMG